MASVKKTSRSSTAKLVKRTQARGAKASKTSPGAKPKTASVAVKLASASKAKKPARGTAEPKGSRVKSGAASAPSAKGRARVGASATRTRVATARVATAARGSKAAASPHATVSRARSTGLAASKTAAKARPNAAAKRSPTPAKASGTKKITANAKTVAKTRRGSIQGPVEQAAAVRAKKPTADKSTVEALLAFKRNAARLEAARKRDGKAAAEPAAVSLDLNLNLKSNELGKVNKRAERKVSVPVNSRKAEGDARQTVPAPQAPDVRHASPLNAAGRIPGTDRTEQNVAATADGLGRSLPASEAQGMVTNASAIRPGERSAPPIPKAAAKTTSRPSFKSGEFVVYPSHGVGQILAIEEQVVAGFKLELYVISFIKDKMILKVPTPKAASVGMRQLADAPAVKTALDTLAGRARIKRTMWSRRAQEYEAKINSGDLKAIAEVVRDLYRSDSQPEQSYSERQLYEAALDRIARELAVVQKLTETESLNLIEAQLQKGPRRGKAEEVESEEPEIEEAA